MMLSKNFSLDELTMSQTASRKGIENSPTLEVINNLRFLAENLEKVRELLNAPIIISSGFRSTALNTAIGGSKSSQHVLGQAADFTAPVYGTPEGIMNKLVRSDIQFDQVILEFEKWIHISFSKTQARKQALVIDNKGTRLFVNSKETTWQETAVKSPESTAPTVEKKSNPLLDLINLILAILKKSKR